MTYLVSVIIPVYNREKTIYRAVDSVLKQSYKNVEVIIVDDCSTDNTLEVIQRFEDDRIKVYQNSKNRGACYSRNKGVRYSQGDYIAFQDSDDEWEIDKLKICLESIEKGKYDLVFSSYVLNNSRIIPEYDFNKVGDKVTALIENNCISTQTIFAKKDVFLKEPFDNNLPRYQDMEVMIRIAKKYKIYFIDTPLVRVYLQEDSITKNKQNGVIALKIIFDKHKEDILKNKNTAAKFYANMGVHCEKAGMEGTWYFKQSLKCRINIKNFVRYVLALFRIYHFVDNSIVR